MDGVNAFESDAHGLISILQAGLNFGCSKSRFAIKRVCDMAGSTPACMPAEASQLRETLSRIRPAAHGITAKSYSNVRSRRNGVASRVGR